MPTEVATRLLSWASDIEPGTIEQAARAARLPFISGHVALMPDAHIGIGATVGSVIPTKGAIIPAAVGVDIGCGMTATETTLTAADLPDSLAALMPLIERRIPAGVGQGHDDPATVTFGSLDRRQGRKQVPRQDKQSQSRQMRIFPSAHQGRRYAPPNRIGRTGRAASPGRSRRGRPALLKRDHLAK